MSDMTDLISTAAHRNRAGKDVTDLHHRIADLAARSPLPIQLADEPGIACTLAGGEVAMRARIDEWRAVIAKRTGRRPTDGGVTLTYSFDPTVAVELARLGAAEFDCCSFFTFSLTVSPAGMVFTVTAPSSAADLVAAMFGDAAHG